MDRTHNTVGSWIIVSKETGKPVVELFSKANVERINREKYMVYTAQEWLGSINGQHNK